VQKRGLSRDSLRQRCEEEGHHDAEDDTLLLVDEVDVYTPQVFTDAEVWAAVTGAAPKSDGVSSSGAGGNRVVSSSSGAGDSAAAGGVQSAGPGLRPPASPARASGAGAMPGADGRVAAEARAAVGANVDEDGDLARFASELEREARGGSANADAAGRRGAKRAAPANQSAANGVGVGGGATRTSGVSDAGAALGPAATSSDILAAAAGAGAVGFGGQSTHVNLQTAVQTGVGAVNPTGADSGTIRGGSTVSRTGPPLGSEPIALLAAAAATQLPREAQEAVGKLNNAVAKARATGDAALAAQRAATEAVDAATTALSASAAAAGASAANAAVAIAVRAVVAEAGVDGPLGSSALSRAAADTVISVATRTDAGFGRANPSDAAIERLQAALGASMLKRAVGS